MKAPIPSALAPEPTGLGDEAISTVSTGWAKAVVEIGADVAMNRTRKQIMMLTRKLLFISNSAFQYSIFCYTSLCSKLTFKVDDSE
jgi:hypothetical protein